MKKELTEYWIIIDLVTCKALYGLNTVTLKFSTHYAAEELASQLCNNDYICIFIKLK